MIKQDAVEAIKRYNSQKELLDQLNILLSAQLEQFIKPYLDEVDVDALNEIQELLVNSYWQFEIRRRLRSL